MCVFMCECSTWQSDTNRPAPSPYLYGLIHVSVARFTLVLCVRYVNTENRLGSFTRESDVRSDGFFIDWWQILKERFTFAFLLLSVNSPFRDVRIPIRHCSSVVTQCLLFHHCIFSIHEMNTFVGYSRQA